MLGIKTFYNLLFTTQSQAKHEDFLQKNKNKNSEANNLFSNNLPLQ